MLTKLFKLFSLILLMPTLVINTPADAVPIAHNQQTLGPETVVDGLGATGNNQSEHSSGTITNSTGVTWYDYHFSLVNDADNSIEAEAASLFDAIGTSGGNPPFTNIQITDHLITLSGGKLPPGGTFNIDLDIIHSGESVAVLGTPTLPEPSTWLLMGTGLLGLLGYGWRQRKQLV